MALSFYTGKLLSLQGGGTELNRTYFSRSKLNQVELIISDKSVIVIEIYNTNELVLYTKILLRIVE